MAKQFLPDPAGSKLLLSGNEAVARAVWESGCKVAAAYPGTPSTEMLESLSKYPTNDIYTEWSVNEKVSLEVAIGAAYSGSRSFCCMKHVGLNVAADALMTLTLTGVIGGLVIAVADDVGLSSSQNEQDSRYWGRFAHLPILEPADSQEAYTMAKYAFELSEQFQTPVILRMTTRINHVKGVVVVGERIAKNSVGFAANKDPNRWVMTPNGAIQRLPLIFDREEQLRKLGGETTFNFIDTPENYDKRLGFITSGAAFMHVKEAFPNSPVLKLGFAYPLNYDLCKNLSALVDEIVVVEEVEPLIENEIKANGVADLTKIHGKDILPRIGELSPEVIIPAVNKFFHEKYGKNFVEITKNNENLVEKVFPRPPTMCVACPHLGVYYTLSQVKNLNISGDIGCYTLGAGEPWHALDTTISMGASMGIALGMDKGRGESDANKRIVAVIGDSTFMHMGMTGLLDIVYNRGNVTIILLDNRAVGMTGGQDNPANGRDIHGEEAPRIDFEKLVIALGVKPERTHVVDPYKLPVLFKTIREEVKVNDVSVIITNQPCVLIKDYHPLTPYQVEEDKCTGCKNCLDVGCPAIHVTRRDKVVKPSGREVDLAFVNIESEVCTGCGLCLQPCAPNAIVPWIPSKAINFVAKEKGTAA